MLSNSRRKGYELVAHDRRRHGRPEVEAMATMDGDYHAPDALGGGEHSGTARAIPHRRFDGDGEATRYRAPQARACVAESI